MSEIAEKPKGRGRPRKYPVGQSPSELLEAARLAGTIRPRGRPPKSGKPSTDPSATARPKSAIQSRAITLQTGTDPLSSNGDASTKRKRGRPPKVATAIGNETIPGTSAEPTGGLIDETTPPKKKRGRKPKTGDDAKVQLTSPFDLTATISTNTTVDAPVKRGRGRPPKVHTTSQGH